jgi:hypothetical protein
MHYRIYLLGLDGLIRWRHDVHCSTDAEAFAEIAHIVGSFPAAELWCEDRRVGRWTPSAPVSPRCIEENSTCNPVTIESQIIDFLFSRRSKLLCHPCIRRNLTLPDVAEIDTALQAIGNAITFRRGNDECGECRGIHAVVGAR